MSSVMADIADAIVTDLDAGSFSQAFTAARKWIVKWMLPELSTLRVTVVPGPATFELVNRGRDKQHHEMDIAVQKKVDPSDNTQVDDLVGLMEEFVVHFRGKDLVAGSTNVLCTRRQFIAGSDAAVAPEHLHDLRTFTGVLRTTWLVRQ